MADTGLADTSSSTLPPRVVLLDVDGVLHPFSAQTEFFDGECMKHLRRIIEQSGALLVLSSSWQSTAISTAEVESALRRWGIPSFDGRRTVSNGSAGGGEHHRAREIASWVERNSALCTGGWVCIDDLDLLSVAPPPRLVPLIDTDHFVHTSSETGLTAADADRAVALLGGPDTRAPPLPPPQHDDADGDDARPAKVQRTRGEVQRDMIRAALA